jgi:Endonuclease/Exonuclease/phosphatase family
LLEEPGRGPHVEQLGRPGVARVPAARQRLGEQVEDVGGLGDLAAFGQYRRLRREGQRNVAVLGDFNDTPDSQPLRPLLQRADLRDVSKSPAFVSDGREGTFGTGAKSAKFDYILLSPALFKRVTLASVFRKGVWGGKHGTLSEHYPTMTKPVEAASDHAAIYADLAGL